ncbi:hypothetical protein HDU78_008562 [Chytriomyces hyalinus]|nr:hypothetical protein HDU78_008562 [Chytriomyces hyalinus]KAJ3264292.1 hypothetical protein HDU77_008854 [Chytriomyces hyalinus]
MPSASPVSLFKLNRIWDVIMLALAFFFVFLAFSVVQNMASTVLPSGEVAFPALGTLYLAFAFFNLFGAAPLVDRIGTRPAMFFATLTYTLFDASNVGAMLMVGNVGHQLALLVPASLLIGAGAAVLWTAQGSYVIKCATKETIGRYTGVFFGIMSASNMVGPLFTGALLQGNVNKEDAFKILTGLGALGPLIIVIFIWGMRAEPSNPEASPMLPEASVEQDKTPMMLKAFKLVISKEMLMIAPLVYLSACEQTFNTGSLPLFINTGSPSEDLRSKLYLSAAYGAALTLTSFVIGPITDWVSNPTLIIAVDAIAHLAALIALWVHPSPMNNLALLYPCSIVVAMSDATLLNQAYKLVAGLFPANPTAYAAYKFHSAGAIGIFFFTSKSMLSSSGAPSMAIWTPLLIAMFVLAVGTTHLVSRDIEWKKGSREGETVALEIGANESGLGFLKTSDSGIVGNESDEPVYTEVLSK